MQAPHYRFDVVRVDGLSFGEDAMFLQVRYCLETLKPSRGAREKEPATASVYNKSFIQIPN